MLRATACILLCCKLTSHLYRSIWVILLYFYNNIFLQVHCTMLQKHYFDKVEAGWSWNLSNTVTYFICWNHSMCIRLVPILLFLAKKHQFRWIVGLYSVFLCKLTFRSPGMIRVQIGARLDLIIYQTMQLLFNFTVVNSVCPAEISVCPILQQYNAK